MDNIKKKIQENRDLIDRITLKLPGFKGYVEKAEAYNADKILRNLIGERLQGFKKSVNELSGSLVKGGNQDLLNDLEALNLLLEKILKKSLHADFGSAADLAGVAISEDDQNRLLEYDWRLISSLDDCEKLVEEMKSVGAEGLAAVLGNISNALKDFEKSFEERKNVLLEVI